MAEGRTVGCPRELTPTERAEARLLKVAMGLPEPVQRRARRAAGRRRRATLAAETQLMLRLKRLARLPGPASLPVRPGAARARCTRRGSSAAPSRSVRCAASGRRACPARLYTPTGDPEDPTGLLVFFHGGGFVFGDLDSHDHRAGSWPSGPASGCSPWTIGSHPSTRSRRRTTTRSRRTAGRSRTRPSLGVDPDRLAVGGDSAGGNLAAAARSRRRGRRPSAGVPAARSTRPPTRRARTRSSSCSASGFYLTREYMDLANEAYLPDRA